MKKIIYSLLVIVAVASVAGAVTYAGWNDTDTSVDNKIQAGSLELEWAVDDNKDGVVNAGDTWTKEPNELKIDGVNVLPLNVAGAYPTSTRSVDVYVRNAGGTVDGTFTVDNVAFVDKDSDGVSIGQLSQFIDLRMQMNRDSDGALTGRIDELAALNSTTWNFGGVTLSKDGTPKKMTITWWFVDPAKNTNGTVHTNDQNLLNATMGDSVFIDFTGTLTQK